MTDHVPLHGALGGDEVIPLFVLDPNHVSETGAHDHPHRVQFALESLHALEANLAHLGSRLVIVAGKSTELLPKLAAQWKVDRVLAQRTAEPAGRERDRKVRELLHVPLTLTEGETLQPPETIRTQSDTPFLVYSAFARAFATASSIDPPLAAPKRLPPLPPDVTTPSSAIPTLESLGVVRNERVIVGGEKAARQRLQRFVERAARQYHVQRDRMDLEGTSRLSADLRFGTLSPRTVWTTVQRALSDAAPEALRVFHNELTWREFTHATLWDRPELLHEPFQRAWVGFPWQHDDALWQAWIEGRTGYPIVDAACRQLMIEGFVHNRARMISASFLTKHLLCDYRRGEAHYLRFLVDGDRAQNNAGWQWSAGCGCDAQPYFRVFNPVTQGQRFDPNGDYVRRFVPELAQLPNKWIHAPWTAPEAVLKQAGVPLGTGYPRPIVDHKAARERFLALATQHVKQKG